MGRTFSLTLRAWGTSTSLILGGVGLAEAQTLPTLYVHARTGCNSNPGTAAAPYETITRALQEGSLNTSAPRTIMVAGAFGGGVPIPYDELANPVPNPGCLASAGECFPLWMLPQVSLVWDVANSDDLPDLAEKARSVVRWSAFALGNPPLIRFTNPANPPVGPPGGCSPHTTVYSPAGSQILLQGLDFEAADPAIEILDNLAGSVSPTFTDLHIGRGLRGILITASSG